MGKDFYQSQECSEPNLMVLAGHAFLQVFRTHLPPACFHHLARNRDLNAQKHIPLTVLAGAGFEEARQSRHLGGIGMANQGMKQHIHLCKDTRKFWDDDGKIGLKCGHGSKVWDDDSTGDGGKRKKPAFSAGFTRARYEARTRDLRLGKPTLYQLS